MVSDQVCTFVLVLGSVVLPRIYELSTIDFGEHGIRRVPSDIEDDENACPT